MMMLLLSLTIMIMMTPVFVKLCLLRKGKTCLTPAHKNKDSWYCRHMHSSGLCSEMWI